MTNRSVLIRAVVKLAQQHHLGYLDLSDVFKAVRLKMGLRPPRPAHRLPKLLPDDALKRLYESIDNAGDLKHQIMLRLLLYTGVRVGEFVRIKLSDLDLGNSQIFIEQGKGGKDRYVLFKDSFRLLLKAYMEAHPTREYLFESKWGRPYTTRRVQQIVSRYAEDCGIKGVHPHLFRHQLISWLTANGLSDTALQLITGHSSKKSLEIYQHMTLQQVKSPYQEAMKKVDL